MMPIVNGLEEEFAGQVEVVRLDAIEAQNARLQNLYGLRGHPSFAVINAEDEVVERYFGPQPAETLRTAVEQIVP